VMVSEACLGPGVSGLKATLAEQNAFGCNTFGGWQVSDSVKSAESGPLRAMLLMLRAWAPMLVSVSI